MATLDSLEQQIKDLGQSMSQGFKTLQNNLDEFQAAVAKGFSDVEERFVRIDERFEKVDERFIKIDERFERVDERFDKVDQTLERLERNQLTQKEEIIGLETRATKLEQPVA